MKTLAGQFVVIHFWQMVWDITQIVILPMIAGLLFHHIVKGRFGWLDRAMPLVSMMGIALIIVVITAAERDCRTIALEVGMQNAGLASGIALSMGKMATVGLAPAVFGPMMNVTGSSLATWWHGRPCPHPDHADDGNAQSIAAAPAGPANSSGGWPVC
jgi:BASS family bile acid:Na+ symporter